MKNNLLVLISIPLLLIGCKKATTEPTATDSSTTTNSTIVEGMVTHDTMFVGPVGSQPPPFGYYLINQKWFSQIPDTPIYVYLSGKLDSTSVNKYVWIKGSDTLMTLGGTFGIYYYINLRIDSMYIVN